MSDETIKINREMLRDAIKRAHIEGCEGCTCQLEREIFGPKKPREIWIHRPENAGSFAKV